ncbi:MAG: benzoate-CoA ligase family protein [Pirellulales bacterium]
MKTADIPQYYNAASILERNLGRRADKTALFSAEREMTFAQVVAEANRVGNALLRLGVRPGEAVGILAPDCAEWVTSFFGILKAGAVAVSLNTLLKPAEHAYVAQDSRLRVLIVHQSLLPMIQPVRDGLAGIERVIVIGNSSAGSAAGREDIRFEDWISQESEELTAARTHREDICTLNYSSGTTGGPKGIPHAHKDLLLTAQLWGVEVLGLRESDRTFAAAKLFFTYATGGNLLFPWHVGASVVLMSAPPRIATNVLETIARFQPTIHFNAPTGYASMLAVNDLEQFDLSSLRLCVSAGEALPAPIWHDWKDRTGLDIIDGIGSTEVYHIFLSNRPNDIRPGSSGKPMAGYDLRIVDDAGQDVPKGEVGNLWVRGESTSLSYWHNAEQSRRTFLGPWLVTGDKYFQDEDGYFWHAGRADDMLKVGGIWVSPTEVESTLLGHSAVQECAVVGQVDHSDLIKPKAYVVLKAGHAAGDDLILELIAHCKSKMAEYKRPRWIEFVSELPKTATGKVQRYKLRAAAAALASQV